MAERAVAPVLMVADSNFGIYEEDIEICQEIAKIQKKHGWPKAFHGFNGKNMKERVLEGVKLIQGTHYLNAATQSMSEQVLKSIKRNNIKVEKLIEYVKEGEQLGHHSFSELILGLPGDSKEAHFDSITQLMDAGIDLIRSHQFMLLPDSESATKQERQKYQMITRFRAVPNTFGSYKMFESVITAPEIDEICIGNSTMSQEDYRQCRLFNLTVEIFYNNGIFLEFVKLLKFKGLSIPAFIQEIHRQSLLPDSPLAPIYEGFLRETDDLWESKKALQESLSDPVVLERYRSGELGRNEQTEYRAIALLDYQPQLHEIVFKVCQELLARENGRDQWVDNYLWELYDYSLSIKDHFFSTDILLEKTFHYNFLELEACHFNANPMDFYCPEGFSCHIAHTEEQKEAILSHIQIFGSNTYGLGAFLSNPSTPIRQLFRKAIVRNISCVV